MAKGKGGFIGQDGLNAPDAPTGVSGTAGDTQVTVSWTAPSDVGGSAITGYSVQAADGSGSWQSSYNIESASYDNVSFDVSGQEASTLGISFNNDGTKLYIVGFANNTVYQYSLTTAFDISTASYDSVSFSVATQATIARDVFFNSDGTTMYIVDGQNDSLYQYSLSTAYNVSTASYDSVSFSFATQDSNPQAATFNNDGTKLFMVGTGSDTVYQYSLSSAYDASTLSYDSVSFSVASQELNPYGVEFNSDGSKMFVVGLSSDEVHQYSLSSAFDLSTASYDNISFSVASQTTVPRGMVFNNDGSKMYICTDGSDLIYQYSTGLVDYPTASPVTITGLTNGTSYTFNVWAINAFGWSSPSDASDAVSPDGSRGLVAGNFAVNTIEYFQFATLGNASDFGDLTQGRSNGGGGTVSSSTRGVFGGGYTGSRVNTIDYVTIATIGNATDFGDLTVGRSNIAHMSSSTRGIFAIGYTASGESNIIDYVTIASTGNATDFGDAVNSGHNWAGVASPTRGVYGLGSIAGLSNSLEYITIASTGNGTDFGDGTVARDAPQGCSTSTRGVFAGGNVSGGETNSIDYITIATTGNATDFGDLTRSAALGGGAANTTRGVFSGGNPSPQVSMDYITIATTGNASDFGDLGFETSTGFSASNAHGGLS